METKRISEVQRAQLCQPLPAEAVTPHPTKTYLSSIKAIYVTERLNEVFGTGAWRVEVEKVDQNAKMIVVKVKFSIPEYGIEYECYGGNDNVDLGDAYKGATTDALTKIGSWLGIGGEVFKGEAGKPKAHKPSLITTLTRKVLTLDKLMGGDFADRLVDWLHKRKTGTSKTILDILMEYYEADEEVVKTVASYYSAKYE